MRIISFSRYEGELTAGEDKDLFFTCNLISFVGKLLMISQCRLTT